MTIKKTKSDLKKNQKIEEYKNIQDDIIDYAQRNHFHQVISRMLFAVYTEKSEDPYTFMINYLIENKGSKSMIYGDQKLLTQIQEKDEEIKRLNECIAELQSQISNNQLVFGTQSFKNNTSIATTLTDMSNISVSELEKIVENPSLLKQFESYLTKSAHQQQTPNIPKDLEVFKTGNPMTSNSDVTVFVPTNEEHPATEQGSPNDLILAINFSRLTKPEPMENSEMPLEDNDSTDQMISTEEILDVTPMELDDYEMIGKTVNIKVEVPEKNVSSPANNQLDDDFEPDYEPDDE